MALWQRFVDASVSNLQNAGKLQTNKRILTGFRCDRQMKFEEYQAAYQSKTRLSKKLYARAQHVFAGGINHNIRFFSPYPFFVQKSIQKLSR